MLSVCVYIAYLSFCLIICLSVYFSFYMSVCLSFYQSICLYLSFISVLSYIQLGQKLLTEPPFITSGNSICIPHAFYTPSILWRGRGWKYIKTRRHTHKHNACQITRLRILNTAIRILLWGRRGEEGAKEKARGSWAWKFL